ncbi:hypothetical protein GCM10028813_02260 [Ramlibacter alkalitolerans]
MVVILSIMALIATITAFVVASSQSNYGRSQKQQTNTLAASLMNQGAALLQTASVLIAEGTSPAAITLDATATGLFGPSGISLPNQPAALYATGAATKGWQAAVNKSIAVTGKGTTAVDELFTNVGIATDVCKVVNSKVNGLSSIPAQASLTTTYSWSSGCYSRAGDGLNVFFVLFRAM